MLEVEPKSEPFVSYGDFRGYLYEAPIFSMPVLYRVDRKG